MKVDYYRFECFLPYRLGGEAYGSLKEAKSAYMWHLNRRHRFGSGIYGCTEKDDTISLTYTPFYSDTKTFGRTSLTNIGHAIKNRKYKL